MAAVAFEIQHRVDHVLQHARTGDGAVLGDVADQHQREFARLGELDQLEAGGAHLRHRAGRAVDRVEPHGLDRVDHHQRGVAGRLQAGGDVAQVDRGGEFQRRVVRRRGGGRAGGSARSIPRRRCRAPAVRRAPGRRPPAAAGWTCRSRDRRRPGRPRPGTSPPPSTRSSSAMPVGQRGGGSALPARSTNATRRADPALAAGPGRGAIASSTMVFHSPQASQRPAHLGLTAPQLWQTKREVGLANGRSVVLQPSSWESGWLHRVPASRAPR